MDRTLALVHPLTLATGRLDSLDLARRLIVVGCAAALIMAGAFSPF